MSTSLPSERLPWESDEPLVEVFDAPGFPPGHPAEPDLFIRQQGVPGHDQVALEKANVVMVGAGGLGSWTGLGLVRSGVKRLTIIDPDRYDRTNAHRQLVFPEDLGRYKASSVAKNLVPHMIAGGAIRAINLPFEEACQQVELNADVLLVLVDNNRCRLAGCQWARVRRIPAVFAMLSLDGTRMQAFLQGPNESDACLWCALPNLDAISSAPCAMATIAACYVVVGYVLPLVFAALSTYESTGRRNWFAGALDEASANAIGLVRRRQECPACRR